MQGSGRAYHLLAHLSCIIIDTPLLLQLPVSGMSLGTFHQKLTCVQLLHMYPRQLILPCRPRPSHCCRGMVWASQILKTPAQSTAAHCQDQCLCCRTLMTYAQGSYTVCQHLFCECAVTAAEDRSLLCVCLLCESCLGRGMVPVL